MRIFPEESLDFTSSFHLLHCQQSHLLPLVLTNKCWYFRICQICQAIYLLLGNVKKIRMLYCCNFACLVLEKIVKTLLSFVACLSLTWHDNMIGIKTISDKDNKDVLKNMQEMQTPSAKLKTSKSKRNLSHPIRESGQWTANATKSN